MVLIGKTNRDDRTMKQITQEEKNEVHKHCKAIEEILKYELHKNHEMQKLISDMMSQNKRR